MPTQLRNHSNTSRDGIVILVVMVMVIVIVMLIVVIILKHLEQRPLQLCSLAPCSLAL